MAGTAVLFAGQGAQSVGMGRDIAEASPDAAAVYERANEVLGYDLRSICFEGPEDRLTRTDVQQPAIFTTSVAIWRALHDGADLGTAPAAMAGLSLGEYTALVAAESLSFEDGLKLVQRRGELMQSAAEASAGGMVTALGVEPAEVDELCRQAADGEVLAPANFNCPDQIVVSGSKSACERIAGLIQEAGGRAIPLKVAGAFHSPLMQPAADALAEALAGTDFNSPRVPVIANVNCQPHQDAVTIRSWLTRQLTHPVRWQASIEQMIERGVDQFVEIGPGRALTGMVKKISRRTPVTNISAAGDLARRAEAAG